MTYGLENRYLDLVGEGLKPCGTHTSLASWSAEIISLGNQQLVAPPESLPLDNDDQEPCSNVMDKWEIPRITVHRDSTGDHTLPASADNAPKQEAEPPAGKKGTLHALRK